MNELVNRHYLTPLFEPQSVAIFGASETAGKIGAVLISNMLASAYRGALFAVNPKYRSVHGVPCFASIDALPQRVDLAVVATPAHSVPEVIEQCGMAGVRAAVVITAGFSESGVEGAKLERSMLANARRHGMRIIGPNCLGILRPALGLNAAFARNTPLPGSLGLISQSGAVCSAMLDWAKPNGIGFSSVVSLGGSSDIDFGEIIDYLAYDQHTGHILLYIEGIRDARRFLSSLRATARVKPIILMKVGRHPAGSRAAISHTGAMVGSDDVFDAVVRRAGVVRVTSIMELFAAAQALSLHVHPRAARLAVITNGGGPGVMAADRAADLGLELAELSVSTSEALGKALPSNWSHGNPIDLIGDADSERYRAAISACLADDGVDGVLTILTPQAMTDADDVARAVVAAAKGTPKPLIACWMGEESVAPARKLLQDAGIATFRSPDPAVEVFAHIAAFYQNQQSLIQTVGPLSHQAVPDLAAARRLIEAALAERRSVLSEAESKALLSAFHIPVAKAVIARTFEEAAQAAAAIGYPVAMKIYSPDISHKSDAGGVRLNLADLNDLRESHRIMLAEVARKNPKARLMGVTIEPMITRPNRRELLVGVVSDAVFGPAITFGAGGAMVEVHHDRSVALPPLNAFLAHDMMRRTRIFKALGAFRNLPPIAMSALEAVLLRVSEMVCELPWIEELDINPLLADENGVIALDARIAIRKLAPLRSRYAHMAIHPYPADLVEEWRAPDGSVVTLRPIRPEDAQIEQEFVKGLSAESRYSRFMNTLRELTPAALIRFTQIDYDREMALIAVQNQDGREVEIAVARYVANPDGDTCEYAIVVANAWQGKGLGRRLLEMIIKVAHARGFKALTGYVLASNASMLALCATLGFKIGADTADAKTRQVTLTLAD